VDDTAYTVGALAKASGLTVRTRILALRAAARLGLSLDEIAAALDREGPELEAAVRAHLARVEDQLTAVTALRDRLTRGS
jgi:DNA-binding transcriptional MerR regulator